MDIVELQNKNKARFKIDMYAILEYEKIFLHKINECRSDLDSEERFIFDRLINDRTYKYNYTHIYKLDIQKLLMETECIFNKYSVNCKNESANQFGISIESDISILKSPNESDTEKILELEKENISNIINKIINEGDFLNKITTWIEKLLTVPKQHYTLFCGYPNSIKPLKLISDNNSFLYNICRAEIWYKMIYDEIIEREILKGKESVWYKEYYNEFIRKELDRAFIRLIPEINREYIALNWYYDNQKYQEAYNLIYTEFGSLIIKEANKIFNFLDHCDDHIKNEIFNDPYLQYTEVIMNRINKWLDKLHYSKRYYYYKKLGNDINIDTYILNVYRSSKQSVRYDVKEIIDLLEKDFNQNMIYYDDFIYNAPDLKLVNETYQRIERQDRLNINAIFKERINKYIEYIEHEGSQAEYIERIEQIGRINKCIEKIENLLGN